MSVASDVRRKPRRSSDARGVTATVSSHRAAANGRRAAESVSMRMMSSPPGIEVSAEVPIEKLRKDGDAGITSAASSMAIADATASRRSRSTSTGSREAPMTNAGSATSAASHSRGSLIPVVSLDNGG